MTQKLLILKNRLKKLFSPTFLIRRIILELTGNIQQELELIRIEEKKRFQQTPYLIELNSKLKELWKTFFPSQDLEFMGPFFAQTVLSNFQLDDIHKTLSYIQDSKDVLKYPRASLGKKKVKNICYILAMTPTHLHAGGLRFFDLIQKTSPDYNLYLYSTSSFETNYESFHFLEKHLKSTRMVSWEEFSEKDFTHWVNKNEFQFDLIYLSWPDSTKISPWKNFPQANIFFEMIECNTRRYHMAIQQMHPFDESYQQQLISFFYFLHYELESLKQCDQTIYMTHEDEEFAKKFLGAKKTFRLPTCVSDYEIWDKITPEMTHEKGKEYSALFLGNFDHAPNFEAAEWFIKNVHPQLLKIFPQFQFILAGTGNLQPIIDKYMPLYKQSLKILGKVDNLVKTIQSAQICVAPLFSGAGIRGKVNQYSACHRPTVATSIALQSLPYQHLDSVILANTAEEFIQGITFLFTEPSHYSTMADKAEKLVREEFSTKSLHRQFQELINGI